MAIAAAIKADVCEIYTDVDGVYTTDPNICPAARKIERISFEEMLELASLGAKVLQIRSVEVAMKYGVPVHVRSSFSDTPGTMVRRRRRSRSRWSSPAWPTTRARPRCSWSACPISPASWPRSSACWPSKNVSVDMIIQSPSRGGDSATDVTFTVAKTDLARVKELIESAVKELGGGQVEYDPDIVKVSIVGLGMRSHAGVAAKMFGILAAEGINIQAHQHQRDQDQLHHRRQVHRARGAGPARRLWPRQSSQLSALGLGPQRLDDSAPTLTTRQPRALHEGFGLDKAPS